MSNFTSPLRTDLVGKNVFQVVLPFEYHVGTYPSTEIITVPEGFLTDFASVPRVFWPIIGPIDNHGKAAVVHDYLYRYKLYSKIRSDDIFLEAMGVLNVEPWKKICIYYAVRGFSHYAWYFNKPPQVKT